MLSTDSVFLKQIIFLKSFNSVLFSDVLKRTSRFLTEDCVMVYVLLLVRFLNSR